MVAQKKGYTPWLRHSGIGLEFVAAIAGFAAIGYWIQSRYGWEPWGVVIGAGLGLIGGTYNLLRESIAAFKKLPKSGDRDQDRKP